MAKNSRLRIERVFDKEKIVEETIKGLKKFLYFYVENGRKKYE